MATELHLHLGVHKTATTHLQQILQKNCGGQEKFVYVDTESFRKAFTQANRFVDNRYATQIKTYLNTLYTAKSKRLLISEENIIGEAKDMFGSQCLYPRAAQRLEKLSYFVTRFENSTIWLSIRSLDTFLPSLYSEYLRHWPYRPFDQVLDGQVSHSWIPLIKQIQKAFPNSQIKVIPYEQYAQTLPYWLEQMTGNKQHWDLMPSSRPRSSYSQVAIDIARVINPVIRSHRLVKIIDKIPALSRNFTATERKFAPFTDSTKQILKNQYVSDLKEIPTLKGNITLFSESLALPISATS